MQSLSSSDVVKDNVEDSEGGSKKEKWTTAGTKHNTALRAPRGNFADYYAIRKDIRHSDGRSYKDNVSSDKRVLAIVKWINSHRMVEGIHCRKIDRYLDIGCNNGQVTFDLANCLNDQPGFVMCIDIDESLIQKASKEAERRGYSVLSSERTQHSSNSTLGSGRVGYSSKEPRKRIRLEPPPKQFQALTLSCGWTTENGSERAIQMVKEEDEKGYDLITALSITKWIQLSLGDAGIRKLFAKTSFHLKRGGLFIVEPQPFKSYKSLHKCTAPESQERFNLNSMRIFPDDFPWILNVELGLQGPFFIQKRGQDGFLRDLQVYVQPDEVSTIHHSRRRTLLMANQPDSSIPWVERDRRSCV